MKGVQSFREAYNLPAISYWPARIAEAGRKTKASVSLADGAPSFCGLTGVPGVLGNKAGQSLCSF